MAKLQLRNRNKDKLDKNGKKKSRIGNGILKSERGTQERTFQKRLGH